ncbi:uncharacterized protein METZ01_LOCUS387896, partial [marine metagenome]
PYIASFLRFPTPFLCLGHLRRPLSPTHELDLKTCDQNMILSLEQCIPMI